MSSDKPKLTHAQDERRVITALPFNEIRRALHASRVAVDMLDGITEACRKAEADGAAIDPAGLRKWIEDHAAQLNPDTAVRVG